MKYMHHLLVLLFVLQCMMCFTFGGSVGDTAAAFNGETVNKDASENEFMNKVAIFLFQVGLVFGPHVGYLFQLREMRLGHYNNNNNNNGNSNGNSYSNLGVEGYAPLVSLILLTSNTLRLFYFVGHKFAIALLLQAIFAVLVHALMLWNVLEIYKIRPWRVFVNPFALHERAQIISTTSPVTVPVNATSTHTTNANNITPTAAMSNFNEREDAHHWSNPAFTKASGGVAKGNYVDINNNINNRVSSPEEIDVQDQLLQQQFLQQSEQEQADEQHHNWLLRMLFLLEHYLEYKLFLNRPTQFLRKYIVIALTTFVVVDVFYLCIHWMKMPELVHAIGYTALGIESCLVVPQILTNARRHSTQGLTFILIFSWCAGDVVKVIYFFVAKQPLPFIVCGFLQLALDCVIIAQVFMYWGSSNGGASDMDHNPHPSRIAVHANEPNYYNNNDNDYNAAEAANRNAILQETRKRLTRDYNKHYI